MLDVRLPARPESAYEARRTVERVVRGKVSGQVLGDVLLLVSELVTNSLRHAGSSGEEAIRVTARLPGDLVHVEVCDEGRGFRPQAVLPRLEGESGWGLFLVGQLAHRWGVRRDRSTCVWFEIDLSVSRGARASE